MEQKDFRCGKYKYLETLYFVRQYPEQKELLRQLEDDMTSVPAVSISDMPTAPVKAGNSNEDRLISKLLLKDKLENSIKIVETALAKLPEEYREPIMYHTLREATYLHPMFDTAHENTWKKWQQRFIFEVAILRGDGPYIGLIQEYILDELVGGKKNEKDSCDM